MRLFDSRKTPAFTRWAVTLCVLVEELVDYGRLSGLSRFWTGDVTSWWSEVEAFMTGVPAGILDRSFRPLHLAAMLQLSELCRLHVCDSISTLTLRSPLGTPMQCAVGGVRLLGSGYDDGVLKGQDGTGTIVEKLCALYEFYERMQSESLSFSLES
jgi:hypothetical protein